MVLFVSLFTKMWPLPSAAAPSGARSSSSTVATTSPLFGFERPQRAGIAVVGEDDLVVRLVVHDAVEARTDLDAA
jgi:hypothetical protein